MCLARLTLSENKPTNNDDDDFLYVYDGVVEDKDDNDNNDVF